MCTINGMTFRATPCIWISSDDSASWDGRNKLDHIEEHQFPVWKSGRALYIVLVRFVINWNPSLAACNAMPNVWGWDEASAYSETLLQIPNSGYIIIRAPLGKIKSNTSYWFNFTTYMCPGLRRTTGHYQSFSSVVFIDSMLSGFDPRSNWIRCCNSEFDVLWTVHQQDACVHLVGLYYANATQKYTLRSIVKRTIARSIPCIHGTRNFITRSQVPFWTPSRVNWN